MNPDISIMLGDTKFNYRVAAWITCGDKVLLAKDIHPIPSDDFYNMPGGRVSAGEPAKKAIVREMEEELGIKLTNAKPIKVMENFFSYSNKNYHELLFIFEFIIPDFHDIAIKNNFVSKDNPQVCFTWFRLDEVKNLICKPEIIYELAKTMNHHFDYEIGT